jgi:hypothetical protein
LVSVQELAAIIGTDLDTINNWLRRGIINRASVGGRQLRSRLFSTEQVQKAALINELVKLGLLPSDASEAVKSLWREWDQREVQQGHNIYGVVLPANDRWTASLCWQKASGGPLFKFEKTAKSTEPFELPDRTFAMLPISKISKRTDNCLSRLMG